MTLTLLNTLHIGHPIHMLFTLQVSLNPATCTFVFTLLRRTVKIQFFDVRRWPSHRHRLPYFAGNDYEAASDAARLFC